jgi:YidC/Oxa1 family membrane protein insertase
VVIQGEEAVEIPRKAVPDEGLNPLVITSSGGEGLDLSTHSFERKEESQRKAVYELALETGLTVTKSFELAKDDYLVTMEVVFENVSDKPLRVANHEIKVGTVFPQDARAGYRDIQFTVLGAGKAQKLKTNPKKTESESFDFVRWASAGNKYFALILSPERRKNKYKVIPEVGELAKEAGPAKKSSSKTEDSYFYSLGIGLEGFTLQPKVKIVHRYSFYAGPKEYDRLKRLSRKFSDDRQFEKVMRFGWFSFVGVPLLKVLKASYKVIPNYGLAIIFLTILIKVVLYPLDQKSYKSMKEMQKVQPLMAEIKKKYKDDPRRAQVEQMKLFKEHKVNPLGGCLPMLFQMPVLIAMFQMLRSAVELWRAPFVLWIKDLSQPDAVVDFHVELPLFGHFTLNILPLLLIGTFVLQTKVSKMGGSPSQQDPQQKAMGHMMTVVFGIIFYNMPSGLTLYFTVSTLLRLVQQYYVQKKG